MKHKSRARLRVEDAMLDVGFYVENTSMSVSHIAEIIAKEDGCMIYEDIGFKESVGTIFHKMYMNRARAMIISMIDSSDSLFAKQTIDGRIYLILTSRGRLLRKNKLTPTP